MTKTQPHIVLLNGPNLNMLGHREPDIYGFSSLEDIEKACKEFCDDLGFELTAYQSNHEGELIDKIHHYFGDMDALIINPGALTHTSIALRDSIAMLECPVIEVHLSNIYKREEFRHHSYISSIATAVLSGCGPQGYLLALQALDMMLSEE